MSVPHVVSRAIGLLILFVAPVFGMTQISGTFKLPNGQSPLTGGVRRLSVISGVDVFGTVDFTPVDPSGVLPLRLICAGVTVLPSSVRAWVNADGRMIDATGNLSITLYATVGCNPVGAAYRAKITLNRTATNPETIWTETKQIPDLGAVDWGSLNAAALVAPAYARIGAITMALQSPQLTDTGLFQFKPGGNFIATKLSCSVDQGSLTVNMEVRTRQNPNDTGPKLVTVDLVCAPTPVETTTIALPNLTADNVLTLAILDKTGSPGIVRVFVDYKQIP